MTGLLQPFLLVALGSAAGGVLRFGAGVAAARWVQPVALGGFPYATLGVNVLGSLLMGVLAGWLGHAGAPAGGWQTLLGVGMLGGFTTFSTFSLEAVSLIERGAPALALAYVVTSLGAGIGALWLGMTLTRSMA